MTIQYLPTFPERPTNPARCNVRTGDIEINLARWNQLSEAEREFVLQHEIGHYKESTFNEVKADQYALRQLALKKPYSLRNYLYAVNDISYGDEVRVNQAKRDVLEVAANNGSKEAQELLRRDRESMAAADGSNRPTRKLTRYIAIAVGLLVVVYAIKQVKNG